MTSLVTQKDPLQQRTYQQMVCRHICLGSAFDHIAPAFEGAFSGEGEATFTGEGDFSSTGSCEGGSTIVTVDGAIPAAPDSLSLAANEQIWLSAPQPKGKTRMQRAASSTHHPGIGTAAHPSSLWC